MKKYTKIVRCAMGVFTLSFTLASGPLPERGNDSGGGKVCTNWSSELTAAKSRKGDDGSGGGLKLEDTFDQLVVGPGLKAQGMDKF